MKPVSVRSLPLVLGAALLWFISQPSSAAPEPVRELRLQKVGDLHYFHIRLEFPPEMVAESRRFRNWWEPPMPSLAPRLVDPDGRLSVVCERFTNRQDGRFRDDGPRRAFPDKDKDGPPRQREPRRPVPVEGLEFIGRYDPKATQVKAKLLYPVPGRPLPLIGGLVRQEPPPVWREMPVVLDFARGKIIASPTEAGERRKQEPWYRENERDPRQTPRVVEKDKDKDKDSPRFKDEPRRRQGPHDPPVVEDLEGLWAVAQADQFRELSQEVHGFPFYRFATQALARKYRVEGQTNRTDGDDWRWRRDWEWEPDFAWRQGGERLPFDRDLYNLTTGATAITESLQTRRLNRWVPLREEERVVPLADIEGITIAEHPWEKMMEGKKPADEPMARMIPHDNYYISFRDPAKMLEFAALLGQWGGNINRMMELSSRDYRLWQRYERQLCLSTTAVAKNLGSLNLKAIGITGSDAYLQDGTDITLLLTTGDAKGLLAGLDPLVGEARKTFGARLKETQREYQGVRIESFVTPLREVSLHRAILGDVVLLSNSEVALKRVIDTTQGKGKRLADSLDFQYMRVVFRADDRSEDGFLYLPDAFIRNFVGPASRIKQKRRLEALVSLHTLTHGAMLTAWETGKAPASIPNLLDVAGLRGEEVPVPDGKSATWDSDALCAVSEVYGTIHFATPLVELDVTRATRQEAEEYRRFRLEYLGLWRQFFDPIGMRLAMTDGQVKLETYILPLIQNSAYNGLRRITGSGSLTFDPSRISSKTLVQYLMKLSSDANERLSWFGPFGIFGPPGGFDRAPAAEVGVGAMIAWAIEPLGEWFLMRIDESPNYEKLVRMAEASARGARVDVEDVARAVWTLPIAFGVDVKNPLTVGAGLTALRTSAMLALPGGLTWAPLEKDYKGVPIVRVGATVQGRRMMMGPEPGGPGGPLFRREPFLPAIYYAMMDGGLYMALNEEMIRELIDTAQAKKEGKGQTVEAATTLHLAPGAAVETRDLIKRYVELQTNQQVRTVLPIWYALNRCNLVPPDAKADVAAETAYRYLGYVPVSPDGTAFRYDRATDEVSSERHGSFRRPVLERTTAESSPVNVLLDTLQSVRTDLRFREDGIHTTITMERAKPRK